MSRSTLLGMATLLILTLAALPVMADSTNPLTGTYYGTAVITSPANLGTVDLAYYLDVSGNAIQHDTSYTILEKTLLFASVTQVGGKDVGPLVNGSVSTTSFSLTVDRFSNTVANKTVFRDIALSNGVVWGGGESIGGDYTEIIIGMDKNPITLTGKFVLLKPGIKSTQTAQFVDMDKDGCFNLDEIKAGGSDPLVVEYSDISYALYLYNNSDVTPNICGGSKENKGKIINDALQNYYNSLK